MSRPAFKPQKRINPGLPKAAVQRLFDQVGGVERVAAKLGYRGTSHVYAMADGNDATEVSFAQVVALTEPTAPAAAEYLAAIAGGVFLPMPAADTHLAALTAEAMREAGQAGGMLIEKMQGGLTPAEAQELLPELADVLRCFSQLYSEAATVAKQGGESPG